ncbi:hypothetical protein ACFXKC_32600 [Streptomyces sp. NPDC059340]|uniref:hypothetical protein n=1 Tax=Streptomyces sp. NPDC059340 TaxID=3346806 RepID=UPI0036B6D56A
MADITDQQQAAAAVESVVAELGRLDTVVDNAGFMGVGQAVDSPHRSRSGSGCLRSMSRACCTSHTLRCPPGSPRAAKSTAVTVQRLGPPLSALPAGRLAGRPTTVRSGS